MDIALSDLRAVFDAAENLLSAREAAMVTRQEWAGLEMAVTMARESANTRLETFSVERAHLVRRVVPDRGTPYRRRCSEADFKAVAGVIASMGSDAFIADDLCRRAGVGRAAGLVAMALFKTRGLLAHAGHGRHAGAPAFTAEAAMDAYRRLADQA